MRHGSIDTSANALKMKGHYYDQKQADFPDVGNPPFFSSIINVHVFSAYMSSKCKLKKIVRDDANKS